MRLIRRMGIYAQQAGTSEITYTNTYSEWEQRDSTNPYMTGDKVTHNGKTWVSDVDNNVWEPGVYRWTEVEE